MPTPRTGYKLADGTPVPGVTTILGNIGWKSTPLMLWAHKQGLAGLPLRETQQKAADVGTIAHEMVDCHIHGRPFNPAEYVPELLAEAQNAFSGYVAWASRYSFQVIETEIHLVSEQHRFGGTPDCIGLVDGKPSLFDWKTSNGVYPDYVCQLAAYWNLWNECRPDLPLEPGAHLVRFGKDGGFSHSWITGPKLDLAWEAFLCARKLHDYKKPLTEAA